MSLALSAALLQATGRTGQESTHGTAVRPPRRQRQATDDPEETISGSVLVPPPPGPIADAEFWQKVTYGPQWGRLSPSRPSKNPEQRRRRKKSKAARKARRKNRGKK